MISINIYITFKIEILQLSLSVCVLGLCCCQVRLSGTQWSSWSSAGSDLSTGGQLEINKNWVGISLFPLLLFAPLSVILWHFMSFFLSPVYSFSLIAPHPCVSLPALYFHSSPWCVSFCLWMTGLLPIGKGPWFSSVFHSLFPSASPKWKIRKAQCCCLVVRFKTAPLGLPAL